MSIQPGNGYNFASSSQGTSLDIDKPWVPPQGDGIILGWGLPKIKFPDINGPEFPEALDKILQFEVQTLVVGNTQYVRIASGAVNFTVSNMPEIWKGVAYDDRQAWIYRAAVHPGITAIDGGDSGSPWMENGGYYSMPSAGTYYVVISKLDIAGSTSSSALLQENVPFVSIFSSGSSLYDKIFSETGPSHYINKTNVQKMAGYNADSTGLSGDFGNCHTTWFLPVKWGYACKIIAVIESFTPEITEPTIEVLHTGTSTVNAVHRVTLPPDAKKSGSFQLQYAPGFTSDTTDPFDPFNPLNSGNLSGQFQGNLSNALKAIQSLRGNTTVTASGANKLDITYVGELGNTAVALPAIINNSIGVPGTTYDVMQHVVGSIDMTSHPQFLGTTLMNVAQWVESEDDEYNAYEQNGWNDISNYLQKDGIEGISANTLDFYELMLSPNDWTSANYSWAIPGTCINENTITPTHPYKVIFNGSGEGGSNTFSIVLGSTNNVVPTNIAESINVGVGNYVAYLKHPYANGNFPDQTNFEWAIAASIPADTDAYGYVYLAEITGTSVEQIVTGSLWGDRLKIGTQTAHYYFARV